MRNEDRSRMSATALQTTGFVSGAIGTVGVLAATVMDVWCTEDQQEHKATSIHHYKGLWKDCEVSQTGLTECQPLYSYLSYSRILQAIRAMMIVAILVGVIAVFIAFFCLKCLNMRSMDLLTKGKLVLSAGILFIIAVYADQIVPSFMMQYQTQYNQRQGEKGGIKVMQCLNMRSMDLLTKGKLVLSAGILFIIAGIFDISGSSVYADQIVPSFMMQYQTQYNQRQGEKGGIHCGNGMGTGTGGIDSFASRYTFGPALYVAWVGGALLLLGGTLKCIAFNTMQT
ncbi:claudin-18-like [Sinocyclocheilus grahami]|uniref:claudin-18-like n=1 Tax=Sinocyclocheilus grahami TaxID=75366 RepID=UPI0007AD196C|nr:PREDICTED: claudin-18-like [Sinocyclocheilus grahami]